jgi:hypothetical protein
MKRRISLLLLFVCILGFSQAPLDSTKVGTSWIKSTNGASYGYFWGTATDTLLRQGSLSQIIRIKAEGTMSMSFTLYCHRTSGTVTNKFIFYKSNVPSPYKWEKVDSISNTALTTGYVNAKTLSNWIAPFMKIEGTSSGTAQVADYKMYFVFKY